jgi:UDP-N-acetylmuramate--alanine ligase
MRSSSSAAADAASNLHDTPSTDPFRGRRIHFVGIGGSGMSGLARIALDRGALVSGTDAGESKAIDDLRAAGIDVATGEDDSATRLPDDCDLVVASAAIRPDHPCRQAAAARGIRVVSYAEAVGMAMHGRTGVSIAGTHGKSTTTAMLAHSLVACGLDPSFIAGAHCPQLGGGWRVGAERIESDGDSRPGVFVAEACEFNRSFHHHRPTVALVNNVEEDHLDFYGSIDEIVESFRDFARLLPPEADGGSLLIAHEGAHRREITAGLRCRVRTFGFSPAADYQVVFDAAAGRIGILEDGVWITQWNSRLAGDHNALNAAAAAILAHWLGADWDEIAAALADFEGVDRRMQRLGTVATPDGGEALVIDDYGHHPSECEATLRALRARYHPRRLICVFQPHQHSRTRFLLEQFATAFGQADLVIVPEIFFVRDSEEERRRISASDLVDRLRARGTTAMHAHPFEAIVEHLEEVLRGDDLVVVMGAGPVWKIGRSLVDRGDARGREGEHDEGTTAP